MMVIPSLCVCFSFIDVPLNRYLFKLQHTHPGVDKSNQVPGALLDTPFAASSGQREGQIIVLH